MNVLVIIVTYNALKWIDKCLSSINSSKYILDIFVVDNGSNDGTSEYIQSNYSGVIFHQSSTNLGFGRANNIGLNYAINNNYDYVYLLNQDAWIENDTISKLIEIHRKYPKYGILSPFQVQANKKFLDKNFGEVVCSYSSNFDIINDLYFSRRSDIYEVPFVMAAHWLISKDCLCKIGGFSPSFPHYGEDNDYINRAMFHGYKIGIVPGCIGVHDRENRTLSRRKILYMNYIGLLIKLSNINNLPKHPLIFCIVQTLKSVVFNKSIIPFTYLWKIICQWNTIKDNAIRSKMGRAFIHE